jgi:hypothetical protein
MREVAVIDIMLLTIFSLFWLDTGNFGQSLQIVIGFTIVFVIGPREPGIPNFERMRIEELRQSLSRAEAAVEAEPGKTGPVWELSRVQLELYITRNLAQVRNIFWITILVMMSGFGLVLYGVYRAFENGELKIAYLTAASGLITQFIGASFLLVYRSTMSQATGYFGALERINSVGMAVQIVDTIPDNDVEIKQPYRAARSSTFGSCSKIRSVCLIHRFNRRDTGRNFHSCATAVFSKQRSTSATLQAWAMQPRGVNGGSASKTSLIEPRPASARCGSKPSRKCRAIARSLG